MSNLLRIVHTIVPLDSKINMFIFAGWLFGIFLGVFSNLILPSFVLDVVDRFDVYTKLYIRFLHNIQDPFHDIIEAMLRLPRLVSPYYLLLHSPKLVHIWMVYLVFEGELWCLERVVIKDDLQYKLTVSERGVLGPIKLIYQLSSSF
jgi:hypothetical protein